MSFVIMTDSTANLTKKLREQFQILELPFPFFCGNEDLQCSQLETFDFHSYYDQIRKGAIVTTSQINPQCYLEHMRPILEAGQDLLFIGLSSGISGSFQSAVIAVQQLEQEFPAATIKLIDSLGAGLGEGLLALRAAKCRQNGMTLQETTERLITLRDNLYQVFIVDDLMHLKRTGRLSNVGALVGTMLGIKPLLKGNEHGKIVAFEKIRGRKQAIHKMAEKLLSLAQNPSSQLIGITHADCEEDANYLAALVRKQVSPKELLLLPHEPVTGSHIGPGALALFFEGSPGVRLK